MTLAVPTYVDLATVHALFVRVLRNSLGHTIPVPEEVTRALESGHEDFLPVLDSWLALLDLAISPPMLRAVLHDGVNRETEESLLRHYIRKSSPDDHERDKAELVATFLFRRTTHAEAAFAPPMDSDHPSGFEEEICGLLNHGRRDPLPNEHSGLIREFPFICREIDDFRRFDELMDSGVIQRVRDIKARFGRSFYHPLVLATLAAYNVYFGMRFDGLFEDAARQIHEFASALQARGASRLTRVEDDITVEQLAQVENQQLLRQEYTRAQDGFRKVSRFHKAVGRRSRVAAESRSRAEANTSSQGKTLAPQSGSANSALEEGQLRQVAEQIRNFVLASSEKISCLVPLQNTNASLNAAEIEAFRTNFGDEKSFRADYAAAIRQLIALQACIGITLHEFESKLGSAYLWKPHAVSLLWLLRRAHSSEAQYQEIMKTAQQRGLSEKAGTLQASLQRLRAQVQAAARILERPQEKAKLSEVV